jgi:hypothetical protein
MLVSRMFSDAAKQILKGLHFRRDAQRRVSLISLGNIFWDDEMPAFSDLAKLSEEERRAIWSVFAIRFKV